MSAKESAKRYTLFIISLFFSGLGVAITRHGNLGVSPISSVANILSLKFTFLTMGNWLFVTNCLLIAGQIALLRKNFKLIQLLQIPLSFLFGYFTDLGGLIIGGIANDNYFVRLAFSIIGVAVLGFGVSLAVIANVIMNSGEAFVKALADTIKKKFANVKIAFDISWVTLSIILSLIFFSGHLEGTREGTIIGAVMTGVFVKIFLKLIKNKVDKVLCD